MVLLYYFTYIDDARSNTNQIRLLLLPLVHYVHYPLILEQFARDEHFGHFKLNLLTVLACDGTTEKGGLEHVYTL